MRHWEMCSAFSLLEHGSDNILGLDKLRIRAEKVSLWHRKQECRQTDGTTVQYKVYKLTLGRAQTHKHTHEERMNHLESYSNVSTVADKSRS